jgi:TPR repeat protein
MLEAVRYAPSVVTRNTEQYFVPPPVWGQPSPAATQAATSAATAVAPPRVPPPISAPTRVADPDWTPIAPVVASAKPAKKKAGAEHWVAYLAGAVALLAVGLLAGQFLLRQRSETPEPSPAVARIAPAGQQQPDNSAVEQAMASQAGESLKEKPSPAQKAIPAAAQEFAAPAPQRPTPVSVSNSVPVAPPAPVPVAKPAVQQPTMAENHQQANTLFDRKSYPEAAALYDRTCSAGNAGDCSRLGFMYANGQGVELNPSRAAKLYQEACDRGFPGGCANLGHLYDQGKGVDKDNAHAVRLYTQACDAGNAAACSDLGAAYRYGRGVGPDAAMAKQFLAKGCSMGNQWGCGQLQSLK